MRSIFELSRRECPLNLFVRAIIDAFGCQTKKDQVSSSLRLAQSQLVWTYCKDNLLRQHCLRLYRPSFIALIMHLHLIGFKVCNRCFIQPSNWTPKPCPQSMGQSIHKSWKTWEQERNYHEKHLQNHTSPQSIDMIEHHWSSEKGPYNDCIEQLPAQWPLPLKTMAISWEIDLQWLRKKY